MTTKNADLLRKAYQDLLVARGLCNPEGSARGFITSALRKIRKATGIRAKGA